MAYLWMLRMKVEEFHQRLQCFRDVFKAVVTDGHQMEELQLAVAWRMLAAMRNR